MNSMDRLIASTCRSWHGKATKEQVRQSFREVLAQAITTALNGGVTLNEILEDLGTARDSRQALQLDTQA